MGITLPSIASDGRIGVFNPATGRIDYEASASISPALSALRALSSLLPQVAANLQQDLTKANQVNRSLSPSELSDPAKANRFREQLLEEIRAKQDAAREKALADLASVRSRMGDFTKAAEKEISAKIFSNYSSTNTTDLLLRETRETRAWARVKPLLDQAHGKGTPAVMSLLSEIVKTAAAQSDTDTISALFAEIPAWSALTGEITEALFNSIEEALVNASPEKRVAVRARQELKKGLNHLSLSLGQMEHSIKTKESSAVTVDWAGASQPLSLAADQA